MSKSEFTFGEPEIQPGFMCFGIAGATGTGKTYSAMELMVGLVGDGNFGVLDTEQGRAIHYHKKKLGAKGFEFLHAPFNPPYSPDRYKKGVEAAAKQGIKGLIIDSGSHMWEGEGGMQDQVEKRAADLAKRFGGDRDKYQFSAWQKPKADAWDMIQFAKGCGLHVGICMRAKFKNKMVKVDNGRGGFKTEIIPIGYMPIIDGQLPFEMDFCATLDPEHAGVPTFTYKPLAEQFHGLFKKDEMFSRRHGQELLKWCNRGKDKVEATADERDDPVFTEPEGHAMVTIHAPDGRAKDVSADKAVPLLIKQMDRCESEDDVWAYVNANVQTVGQLDEDAKDQFDAASASIVERLNDEAKEAAMA
ncbi:MAG: AAA family ATPase [Geminicoccaceae bacterium]